MRSCCAMICVSRFCTKGVIQLWYKKQQHTIQKTIQKNNLSETDLHKAPLIMIVVKSKYFGAECKENNRDVKNTLTEGNLDFDI